MSRRRKKKLAPIVYIILDEITKEMWGPLDLDEQGEAKRDGWVLSPGTVYLFEDYAECEAEFLAIRKSPQWRLCQVIARYNSKTGECQSEEIE
jgi:hypothetical protein